MGSAGDLMNMVVNLHHPYEHGMYCPAIYFQER